MSAPKSSMPEAIAPRTLEGLLQKWFEWYDTHYNSYPKLSTLFLLLSITFFLVILPLFILANIKDIFEAFVDIYTQVTRHKWIAYLAVSFVWLATILFVAIAYHRQIRIVVTLIRFRFWCARRGYGVLGNTVADQGRELIWSWTRYLGSVGDSADRLPEGWAVACNALVKAYLGGLANFRTGKPIHAKGKGYSSEEGLPILPSNFLLYAYCVEQIREVTSSIYSSSPDVKVSVRTLLTKDITRWYNIQRIHLPGDRSIWCTTEWWEKYRAGVHNNELQAAGICLHRLLRFDPSSDTEQIEDQKKYLRLHIRPNLGYTDDFVSLAEFAEAKKDTTVASIATSEGRWLGGAEFLSSSEEIIFQVGIHPIYVVSDPHLSSRLQNWHHDRLAFTPAYESYRAHHSVHRPSPLKPSRPGAWGKQIDRRDLGEGLSFVRDYDDLFLIEFFKAGQEGTLLGRFGISFRIEEHKDIAGVRLLTGDEVSEAIEQFDKAWEKASEL